MPISKKRRETWDEEQEEAVTKKAKKSTKTVNESKANANKDPEGNEYWEVRYQFPSHIFITEERNSWPAKSESWYQSSKGSLW